MAKQYSDEDKMLLAGGMLYLATDKISKSISKSTDKISKSIRASAELQLAATNEISKSIKDLSNAMARQENLLHQVSGQQAELIDIAKKQAVMMELELQQKQVERVVKEAVFQLRQHLEFIKKNPSALERNFLYRATLNNLANPNIKTQNIDSIEEKEYFVETINLLKKGVQDSIDQMSGEEFDELAKLNSIIEFTALSKQIEQVEQARIDYEVMAEKTIGNMLTSIFTGRSPRSMNEEEKLKKAEVEVETWKIRIEELFPGKNLDEVNSILTEFLKKHPILCEQMDLFKTKTEFDVVLTGVGGWPKDVQVIKEVRAITGLGLKDAKDLVQSVPKTIKEGVKKEEAEEIKKKIEKAGGTVELK
tara:strand:- start:238 stop:1326 length:1089 start_codon:yes stop_codon:yes gene_type:complete